MLGRFDLFVVLRNQVSDRRAVRRALALEAALEELAGELGEDATAWGLLGLGADIDVQLCAENADRRGAVAEELLVTEGLDRALAHAAWERWHGEPARMSRLALALVVGAALVDAAYFAIAEGDTLDELSPRGLALQLRKAADRRGEPGALRAVDCARRLELDLDRAAARVCAGLVRVREDLWL